VQLNGVSTRGVTAAQRELRPPECFWQFTQANGNETMPERFQTKRALNSRRTTVEHLPNKWRTFGAQVRNMFGGAREAW